MGMLQAQQIITLTTENDQLKQELVITKQALQILEEQVTEMLSEKIVDTEPGIVQKVYQKLSGKKNDE